jgi:hypothetical protein
MSNVFELLSGNESFSQAIASVLIAAEEPVCPGDPPAHPTPDDILAKILAWDCGACSAFDVSHGVYWCAGEPGRFRNISLMKMCPRTTNS